MAEMLILIKAHLKKLKLAPAVELDCVEIEEIVEEDDEEIEMTIE